VQDFFRLGLIPAETDFSIFSDPVHGAWPGLDIAFLLDAAAYHTDRDTVDRIKVGSLQVLTSESPLLISPAGNSPFSFLRPLLQSSTLVLTTC